MSNNFFNEYQNTNNCANNENSGGSCSIDPSVYALEELLLNEIKQIAFYVVKLADFNLQNENIMQKAVRALSVILINTSFRLEDYKHLLYSLEADKFEVREKYLAASKEKSIKYELVENAFKLPDKPSRTNLLQLGEAISAQKRKEYEPKKLDLIELIAFFAKTTSINVEKLSHFGYKNSEWNFQILKFLNLTNITSKKTEKLKENICDFSKFSFDIWQKLMETLENTYGKRTETDINFEIKEGKSILVSGSDLDELDKLLEAIGDRKINVYTNSSLFSAFCYPHFQKYKNLIGHFGYENAQIDFTNFKGPVFTTQNFLQKIDNLHRGTIFTTKIISPDKMIRIEGYDFEPLIQNALSTAGFTKEDIQNPDKVTLKYDIKKIDNIIKEADGKDIYIIVGSYKKEEIIKKFEGKTLIKLDSPVEIQLLIRILKETNCKNIKLVLTHCTPNTVNILLSTLFSNPEEIYFAKCPNTIINPHIINALVEHFGVEIIS